MAPAVLKAVLIQTGNSSLNTHFFYTTFVSFSFLQRLAIAEEFNDKPAERRACSNLGNAHVFLGEFENAADYYK